MRRVIPTTEQLNNVYVMEWLVEQMAIASLMGDEAWRQALLGTLTPGRIKHWVLSRRSSLAARLLEEISDDAVRELVPHLVGQYFSLDERVARHALLRLATCAPDEALGLMEQEVARAWRKRSALDFYRVMEAASVLGDRARPVVETLAERFIRPGGEDVTGTARLLRTMVELGFSHMGARVATTLRGLGGIVLEVEEILSEVFHVLAPHCPFLDMLFDIEYRRCGYRFVDLPELFAEGTDVEILDRLAETPGTVRQEKVLRRLQSGGPVGKLVELTRELVAELPSRTSDQTLRAVYLFSVAVCAAQQMRRDGWDRLEYEQLVDVLTSDVAFLPDEAALLAALEARTDESRLPQLYRELEQVREYRGTVRLVQLLARLGHASSVVALVDCLGEETDEAAADAALLTLAGWGEVVFEPLLSCWDDMDELARMRVLDLLGMVGGPQAAEHLVRLFGDVVEDEFQRCSWCGAAEAVPDGRFLALLENRPRRREPDIERTYQTVKALVA
jgi:hypothetical protein